MSVKALGVVNRVSHPLRKHEDLSSEVRSGRCDSPSTSHTTTTADRRVVGVVRALKRAKAYREARLVQQCRTRAFGVADYGYGPIPISIPCKRKYCPRCNDGMRSKQSQKLKERLKSLRNAGMEIVFATFTISNTNLTVGDHAQLLMKAWKGYWKKLEWFKRRGYAWRAHVVEVGADGLVHIHACIAMNVWSRDLHAEFAERWSAATSKVGAYAGRKHGLRFERLPGWHDDQRVAQYLCKATRYETFRSEILGQCVEGLKNVRRYSIPAVPAGLENTLCRGPLSHDDNSSNAEETCNNQLPTLRQPTNNDDRNGRMIDMSTLSDQPSSVAPWKKFESIVAAIEKAMAPDAVVEHDAHLPSLSTGHKVQIDVLITQGTAPRQTRAMVEVQDRSRPVEINEFRGWIQKRQDTGVEQLFVVSKHDFPRSIVEAVRKQHGPCIKLMTFQDVERGIWPFEFHLGEFSLTRREILKPACSSCILTEPELPTANFSIHGNVFQRRNAPEMQSLEDLAEEALLAQAHPSINSPGVFDHLLLIPTDPDLWLCVNGRNYLVNFFIAAYKVRRVGTKMPLSVARYQQVDYNGEPTWIASCEGEIEGHPVKVRHILTADERGQFKQYTTQIEGFEQIFGRPKRVHMLMAEWTDDEAPQPLSPLT